MAREWVVTDDLTGERIVPGDMALTLTVLVDDATQMPATALLSLDVAPRPDEELLTDLARYLAEREALRVAARPLDPGSLDETDGSATAAPGGDPGVDESATDAPIGARLDESPQVSDPTLVDESVEDPPDVAQPVATGEAVRGQASTAVLRAWAADHDLPCSTHGRINDHVRASYLRVHGQTPDEQAWTDAGIPADGGRPTLHPGYSTDGAVRVWCQRAGLSAEPALARAAYARAYRGEVNGVALAEHVTPVGDGTRSRPEQLDRAAELAADGATPKQIVNSTGVTLAEARDAVAEAKGGGRR